MERSENCVRRKSYAGVSVDVLEKPKRLSYAGLTVTERQFISLPDSEKVRCGSYTSSLYFDIASMSQNSMQRYRMNRNRQRNTHGVGSGNFSFSQQSLLSAMDRFVASMKNMEATVLVPSRLKDMDGESSEKQTPPMIVRFKTDLFSFYSMLNDVKNELLWGPALTHETVSPSSRIIQGRLSGIQRPLQQVDETITTLGSTCSTSDTDSQGDSDMDSLPLGIPNEQENGLGLTVLGAQTARLTNSFRYHLQGLQSILNQFSDSADYLSTRYQEDVGLDSSLV
ncbi:mid1-interacting protein 1-like [Tachypleus tridentatus]|uniref:mid1-interacting protein 1-like n=1 Tax=Tachypleus tridentatus TaxID=6853 RepID=UPI003FCF2FE3